MSTSRTKRWNGTLESLSPDFLKAVMERMESYGDRVQFELPGHGKTPIYQVIGRTERKMGFDGKHLLLRLNESGNVAESLSPIFSLDAVRNASAGRRAARSNGVARGTGAATGPRSAAPGDGSVRRRTAAPAVAVVDTVEQDKYAYYRAHRDELPEDISQYASEISTLMRAGKSAEEAFRQIVEQHY